MRFIFGFIACFWLITSVFGACDDKINALVKQYSAIATPFCSKWLKINPKTTVVTVTAAPQGTQSPSKRTLHELQERNKIYDFWVKAPPGVRLFAKSKVTSACSCLSLTTQTVKITQTITPSTTSKPTLTTSTVMTTSSTTSASVSPVTTSTTTSQTTTSTSDTTTLLSTTTTSSTTSVLSTIPSPLCEPIWSLSSNIDRTGFNAISAPFSAAISCGSLDKTSVVVYDSGVKIAAQTYTVTDDGVNFAGWPGGYHTVLTLMALDSNGYPFVGTFELLFGSYTLQATVKDANGNPVAGVPVDASATAYYGTIKTLITDANGLVSFTNLPLATIGLIARTKDNQIAVAGAASNDGSLTMTLIPFMQPAEYANFDFANGKNGWTGGETITHVEKRHLPSQRAWEAKKRLAKRADLDLVVSTANTRTLQRASAAFTTGPSTKTVYIKFKFVTSEVPGGWFGSEYNDYFIVTIRSDVGGLATMTNSMNALGLAAFDANGATQWMTLKLAVPSNCKSVQFDIGVSNVGDAEYQSQVIVDKAGDLGCDTCGDCNKCDGDPMCSSTCITPQAGSCAFYRDCVEASKPCSGDPNSYALDFGEKYCARYKSNFDIFTSSGQAFVQKTNLCLQGALAKSVNCGSTCANIKILGFNSHQNCYIANGFCSLSCYDINLVVQTVFAGLFSNSAMWQSMVSSAGCLAKFKEAFRYSTCGGQLDRNTAAVVYATVTGEQLTKAGLGW